MSIATVSVRWLCRKLRQVGEGVLGRRGRYLPTVAWLNIHAELEQFAMDARRAQSSSGGSSHGFRHSSWIDQSGVIAIASGGESPCDAIRSRSLV
jgi:hypothetical protein